MPMLPKSQQLLSGWQLPRKLLQAKAVPKQQQVCHHRVARLFGAVDTLKYLETTPDTFSPAYYGDTSQLVLHLHTTCSQDHCMSSIDCRAW